METIRITGCSGDDLRPAVKAIRQGGLVAVPTETVYGLAANGLDGTAVRSIFELKERPPEKAVSLMVSDPEALDRFGRDVPAGARILAKDWWPGPLTLIVKAAPFLPSVVTAGGDTVGLRCPDEPHTLALLKLCGLPFAAPSANPSGAPSPKDAESVLAYFDGKIDCVIDGGPCRLGTESTIADLSGDSVKILRQGALPEKEIRKSLLRSLNIIGLTGGTGCGKSSALAFFQERGGLVIDADEVYHELCESSPVMLAAIERRFPGTVADGVLQRKKLGTLVFGHPQELAALQEITDYYVDDEITRRLSDFAAFGGKVAAVDAINLYGTGLQTYLKALVGIIAPPEQRCERIMKREGISKDYAMLRIEAQHPNSWFEEHCDFCVQNDSTREEFRARCENLFNKLLEE